MLDLSFFDNYADAVCIFSINNEIIFKNNRFISTFLDFKTLDKFKTKFNFNLCFLSSENITSLTPIDILLKS